MIGRLPLRVFVSAGCAACRRAAELVEMVRRLRPSQPIEVIDLDHHSAGRVTGKPHPGGVARDTGRNGAGDRVVTKLRAEVPGVDEGHYCLSEVALFRDLSRREMAAMAAAAPMRTVATGQVVYDPGRPVSVLFIVKTGRFRLYRVLAHGRTVTTAVPGPGAIFGEMDLLGMRMGGTWAQALEPGDLCLMSCGDVRSMLLGDPRIATRIAEQLGARIADLEQRLADLVGKSVVERTAHTLGVLVGATVAGRDPGPVRLTHEQLAGLVGATRERTTTALGELAERGLVSLHRGRIRIRDRVGLAAVAGGAARSDATGGRSDGSNDGDEGFPRS